MIANRPVSRSAAKHLLVSLLLLAALFQVGCTVSSYYVPVAGERVEWNPGLVKSVNQLTSYSEGHERQPRVSPDGNYVAYVSRPLSAKRGERFHNDVYVMDAATGSNVRPITNAEGEQDVWYPFWIGDDRLLYTRYDDIPDFPRSLYMHDFPPKRMEGYSIVGREQTFWTGGSFLWSGAPSPDGRKIAICLEVAKHRKTRFRPNIFVRQPQLDNPVILMYDMDTKQASHFAYGMDPSWSPDGKNVAYTQRRGENTYIYVKNVATNEERQITYGTNAIDWTPCWSPSGNALAFCSWRDKDWNIYKVDADGTNLMQLTTSKGTEWDPTWGSGGNIYFTFLRTGQDWDIWRLQLNPPSGLK